MADGGAVRELSAAGHGAANGITTALYLSVSALFDAYLKLVFYLCELPRVCTSAMSDCPPDLLAASLQPLQPTNAYFRLYDALWNKGSLDPWFSTTLTRQGTQVKYLNFTPHVSQRHSDVDKEVPLTICHLAPGIHIVP